jgi:hypothetical protein
MNEVQLHVNTDAPIMGAQINQHVRSVCMHVLGLDQIENFLSSQADCRAGEALKAFTAEITNRTWRDPASMARDYPSVSFNGLPKVAFNLAPCMTVVDCLIDFSTATVLIDACRPDACRGAAHCARREKTA